MHSFIQKNFKIDANINTKWISQHVIWWIDQNVFIIFDHYYWSKSNMTFDKILMMMMRSLCQGSLSHCVYMCIPGVVEPIPVGQVARDYLAKAVNPTLLKGLTELCKQKPQDPVVSL